MTREDVQDLLAMIQGTYPNFNPIDKTATVNAWAMALSDYDKNQISLAFKTYMRSNTSGFAPTPGQLIDKIQTINTPQHLNEMEAWSLVNKAIKNSTYHSTEEFEKLPPLVKKSVGLPDQLKSWATDENFSESAVSSAFIKCYRTELAREKEIEKMPKEVQQLIEKVNENSGIKYERNLRIEQQEERKTSIPLSEKSKANLDRIMSKLGGAE